MNRVGLALGGGGLKGLAHIGVLQVLEEYQIPLSCLAGTSAGSIIAALYSVGMSPYEMEKIALELKPSDYLDYNVAGMVKYLLSLALPCYHHDWEGIFYGDKLEKLLFALTQGKKIRETEIPIAIVACNINTGREIVFSSKDIHKPGDALILRQTRLCEAVRASTAIPAVFNPKMVSGRKLVDGGLKSSVPIRWAHQLGAEYLIAVDLGKPYYSNPVSGIAKIASRSLDILIYETTGQENESLADIILRPKVQNVDLDDLTQAAAIIQAGRDAMEQHVAHVKSETTNSIKTIKKII